MQTRKLGNTGFVTSAIGFGCMGLNHHRGPAKTEAEIIKVVHGAIDAGITMFDTAEVYGPYTNEELVGKAIKGKRAGLQIATKGGFRITPDGNEPDSSHENLIQEVEGSLKRLQTDVIDLYYIHRIDPTRPIEEVAETIQGLIKAGKIKHWGLSEASAETIRRAHGVEPLAAVESEYSVWWREPEEQIFPMLEELGIGLVAYSPLGRGYLTGKLDTNASFAVNDNRAELPRFTKEALAANQVVLDLLQKIAEEKQATMAQVSIAWILAQKEWIVPIPGTTKIERIQENSGAAAIQFSSAEMQSINQAIAKLEIVGDRYPQSEKERTGR